jgi:2-dehydro-3-deoxyphosphogluconate aldolase/(4S)-4-hydroxy-2-oxoglutarate aldolase
MTPEALLAQLRADRALVVVRARRVHDPAGLAAALAGAGMHVVELTFTLDDVLGAIEAAAATDAIVGAGTVVTAAQAEQAIARGARFIVSPGVVPEVAAVCRAANVASFLGALSPTEVLAAHRAGASAVKVFPANVAGPRYLRDLAGPFPDIPLLPSGGIDDDNARAFLDAGALAISAGSSVAPAALLEAGAHDEIAARAGALLERLHAPAEGALSA